MTTSLPPWGGMSAMVQSVMAIFFKKLDRAAQTRRRDRYILRHCEERSDEAIQFFCVASGLLRGACHRARIRATRWLAMTERLHRARDTRALFPPKHRLAFFHEGAAALAKILAVHAGGADRLDGVEVAVAGVFQHLRDGDFCGLD